MFEDADSRMTKADYVTCLMPVARNDDHDAASWSSDKMLFVMI